jgi:hypothetical protein
MSTPSTITARSQSPETWTQIPRDEPKAEPPSKVLFDWAIGAPKPSEEDSEEEDSIVTDRPDFTEASSTVGNGRIQLEAGYTWYRDSRGGTKTIAHTYPEVLIRAGLFADWFELRLGQTYAHSRTTEFGRPTEHVSGLTDLYVGSKLGLTEQNGELPEMALILQALVPTGTQTLSADRVLPGFNFLYGWDVIPDLLSAAGSLGVNRAVDDSNHSFVVMSQSFSLGYTITEQIGAYTEWFALYPTGAIAPDVGPQHYFDGGFTYKVTSNLQLDIRAGVGLNERADDFFAGAGFAYRY